jgi:hypothetical protein
LEVDSLLTDLKLAFWSQFFNMGRHCISSSSGESNLVVDIMLTAATKETLMQIAEEAADRVRDNFWSDVRRTLVVIGCTFTALYVFKKVWNACTCSY